MKVTFPGAKQFNEMIDQPYDEDTCLIWINTFVN